MITADNTAIKATVTYLCAHGQHGSPVRRYSAMRENGVPMFTGMYTGSCAGSYVKLSDDNKHYTQHDCDCECHKA